MGRNEFSFFNAVFQTMCFLVIRDCFNVFTKEALQNSMLGGGCANIINRTDFKRTQNSVQSPHTLISSSREMHLFSERFMLDLRVRQHHFVKEKEKPERTPVNISPNLAPIICFLIIGVNAKLTYSLPRNLLCKNIVRRVTNDEADLTLLSCYITLTEINVSLSLLNFTTLQQIVSNTELNKFVILFCRII